MHPRKSPQTPCWKKSSKSGTGPDSNCVEVALIGPTIAIRDTKQVDGDSPFLVFQPANWTAYTYTIIGPLKHSS